MLYSTPASKKRQQSSVNSRLDFDATHAAANLVASQAHMLPAAAPAAQRRADAGRDVVGELLDTRRALRGDTHEYPARPVRPAIKPQPMEVETGIKCCIDFARIDMGVKHAPLLQRWLPLNELNRTTGKQGYTRAEFDAALCRYGIKGGRGYNTRLLRKGDGVYWNLHGGMIYPIGFVELSERILNRAAMLGKFDLFLNGNHPGSRRPMYLDVSGTAHDFEASILSTWYAAHGCPTISRASICALFNRDRRAIWRLETLADIEIIYNEAETTEPAALPLQANGELRGGIRKETNAYGQTTYYIRMVNTYAPTRRIRQHNRIGQGRRAAYSFKRWLETVLHTNSEGGAEICLVPVKVNKVTRTYCKDDKAIASARRRGNDGVLFRPDRPGQWGGVVWRVAITQNT